MNEIEDLLNKISEKILELPLDDKINALNDIKLKLHEISPFKSEPVDCVIWVKNSDVVANDYNPNKVAPPEMKLLERSIEADGYTQPIVSWNHDNINEVVDGFHRHRVGKECENICKRVNGYLPIVRINNGTEDRGSRISATIRHNRARGKHTIDGMAEIVLELKRRNWSDKKISMNLGMDPDEILRLSQITGLAEMFKDEEFSKAWEAEILDNKFETIEEDDNKNLS